MEAVDCRMGCRWLWTMMTRLRASCDLPRGDVIAAASGALQFGVGGGGNEDRLFRGGPIGVIVPPPPSTKQRPSMHPRPRPHIGSIIGALQGPPNQIIPFGAGCHSLS